MPAKLCSSLLLVAALAGGCRSFTQRQHVEKPNTADIRKIHPAPNTSIVRFEQLDDGVFKGSKPKTEADYEFLQSLHVRYIVELRLFPLIHQVEKGRAKAHGMTLILATMNASPITPSEAHVNAVLCLLRDKRYHPVYVHCDLGRDRAALVAGLYDLYYRGMSKEEAWQHMKKVGFKDDWTLRGLKNYFDRHSDPPVTRYIPHCQEGAQTAASCDSPAH